MTDPAAAWATTVYANYRLFGLQDPNCEESQNRAEAFSTVTWNAVGWSTNAFLVESATDLAPFEVRVEVVPTVPLCDAVDEPAGIFALSEAMAGVERYRISLWQISGEPRWPDDDED